MCDQFLSDNEICSINCLKIFWNFTKNNTTIDSRWIKFAADVAYVGFQVSWIQVRVIFKMKWRPISVSEEWTFHFNILHSFYAFKSNVTPPDYFRHNYSKFGCVEHRLCTGHLRICYFLDNFIPPPYRQIVKTYH